VISEAIVAGTPVIASRIAGNVGLLGEEYPGYFDIGDTAELARLMRQMENDADFLNVLKTQCGKLVGLFAPAREKRSWQNLLKEI
jgi:glycosyltransferase involved in cell wall biosynthesis